jgi:hypothetical protein
MERRLLALANAPFGIAVTLLGIVTEVRLKAFSNAAFAIVLNSGPITTSPEQDPASVIVLPLNSKQGMSAKAGEIGARPIEISEKRAPIRTPRFFIG